MMVIPDTFQKLLSHELIRLKIRPDLKRRRRPPRRVHTKGEGKLEEVLALASEDQLHLARTLADWDVAKKVKVSVSEGTPCRFLPSCFLSVTRRPRPVGQPFQLLSSSEEDDH